MWGQGILGAQMPPAPCMEERLARALSVACMATNPASETPAVNEHCLPKMESSSGTTTLPKSADSGFGCSASQTDTHFHLYALECFHQLRYVCLQ